MFFAPPAKVPRTQRLTVTPGTAPYAYQRSTEASSGQPESAPTSLADAVVVAAANGATIPVSSFLSGVGTYMCWLVDENTKLLRLWNVRRQGWSTAAPRLAEIPCFAAAEEGLPLFVCEMGANEESLAFCSERGAVSSLDHTIEVQLIDTATEGVTASCFVCTRRLVRTESVIVTVLGTTAGVLLVDLKHDGTHTTVEFNRSDPAALRWAPNGHNNLAHGQPADGGGGSSGVASGIDAQMSAENADEEAEQQRLSNEDSQVEGRASTAGTSRWLWHSIKSLVGGSGAARGGGGSSGGTDGTAPRHGGAAADSAAGDGDTSGSEAQATSPLSFVGRDGHTGNSLAFTHVELRQHYPEQLFAINAAGEVFLLDFGPVPPAPAATVTGERAEQPRVLIKWATSLPSSLRRRGYAVACSETRHKLCVLYYVHGTAAHPLPALWLVTVDASLGNVVNYVVLNAIAEVVAAAARLPPHHIRVFADDVRCEVIVSVGAYVLRVNNQVGVRQPCASEDTLCLTTLQQPVASLLSDDGLITLDANGPHRTVRDVWASHMAHDTDATAAAQRRVYDVDGAGVAALQRTLDAVQADSKLSLDDTVLDASESFAIALAAAGRGIDGQEGSGARGAGNWARRNLNAEDDNIVQRVTRQLTAQQRAHRDFVMAVLRRGSVCEQLAPTTVAQLLSTQEALLALCALRSMQNVGLNEHADASAEVASALAHRVLPPFSAVPRHGNGGSYLLQRRASRHSDAAAAHTPGRLIKSAEQLERCQQLLRRATVAVADAIRAEDAGPDSPARSLTAAELCFASPANVARLLQFVVQYVREVRATVAERLEEKFAECYAAGCVFVVVAQTIVESREEVRQVYDLPRTVLAGMWTSSPDAVAGVELSFSQACVQLSDMLADACDVLPSGAAGGEAAFAALTHQHRCDLLDVVSYLLYFSLSNSGHRDSGFTASAITSTLLREPFVRGPVGYPFGAPTASRACSEIGRRVLRVSETLALRFGAMPVLMIFALSTPVDEPTSDPAAYARLQAYCLENSAALDAALQLLWEQRREWELLTLHAVLPQCPDVIARRNAFLEAQAPHLLWLADTTRYDALLAEGAACPPYIPYGEDQVTHRSRCNAVAKLAWVATGAAPSSRVNDVQLAESIVAAQRQFLGPAFADVTLGPQAAVQRLLEMDGHVAAWVHAALIASHTMQPTSDDLLVQVLRRCRAHDGEACLREVFARSVSERDTDANLRRTAVGQFVMACARLQDAGTLRRMCETVLTAEEFTLLSSWLTYLWTSSHETV